MNLQPTQPLAWRALALLSLLTLASHATAQTQVDEPWVRATVPGQPATGAFMTLTASVDSKLVSVQSAVAKSAQIHRSTTANEVMRMEHVDGLDLPAGVPVKLDPQGYHIMLMGLAGQVKEGDEVALELTVKAADGTQEAIEVLAPVRALNGHAGHSGAH